MNTLNFIHKTLRLFLIAVLLTHSIILFGQTSNNQQQKDSLRKVIATMQGEDKLNAYMHLAVAYFFESKDELKMDTMLTIYSEMDREAQKQGDIKKRSMIRCNILKAFINAGNSGEVLKRAPEYLDFIETQQSWFHYYNAYTSLVNTCLDVYQFDRALAEAQKMYDKAQSFKHDDGMAQALYAMGKIYRKQERGNDEVHVLRQAIELMKEKTDYYPIMANLYCDLCQTMIDLEYYDELEVELKAFENLNNLYEEEVKREVPTTRANLWGCYGEFYIAKNELDKAEYYYNKIDSALQTNVYKIMVSKGRTRIYRSRKQFDKALEEVNRLIEISEQTSQPSFIYPLWKAEILSEMGYCKESIAHANQAILLKDSLAKIEYARQVDGIRTQYEVDRHIAEKEKARLSFRFAVGIGVSLAGIVILLLVILIIRIKYSRKIHKKNLALVEQILAQEKDQAEIDKLRKIAQENAGTTQETDEIFVRLEKLMQEKQSYTETECNRKTLAEAVGTNEKYLSDSIKNNTDLAVSEYIMKYRLKHANTLLLRPAAEYTIDAVAINSGFGSRSKFHEHYRNHYGITPNEFRKTIQAKKE